MPEGLDIFTLKHNLLTFMDKKAEGFNGFPTKNPTNLPENKFPLENDYPSPDQFNDFEEFKKELNKWENGVVFKWSNAISDYAAEVFPPSQKVDYAKFSFYKEFKKLKEDGKKKESTKIFNNAFKAYAGALAEGMESEDYTNIKPPTSDLDFTPLYNLSMGIDPNKGEDEQPLPSENIDECVMLLAQIIHNWFKKGTYFNEKENSNFHWGSIN